MENDRTGSIDTVSLPVASAAKAAAPTEGPPPNARGLQLVVLFPSPSRRRCDAKNRPSAKQGAA